MSPKKRKTAVHGCFVVTSAYHISLVVLQKLAVRGHFCLREKYMDVKITAVCGFRLAFENFQNIESAKEKQKKKRNKICFVEKKHRVMFCD